MHLLDNLPHPAAIPGETVGGGVEGFSVVTPSLTESKLSSDSCLYLQKIFTRTRRTAESPLTLTRLMDSRDSLLSTCKITAFRITLILLETIFKDDSIPEIDHLC